MTLQQFSKLARQARSRMPRLTSGAAYAQMERLMGRTATSVALSASGKPSSNGRLPAAKSSR
jgi:hypothetical protein